MEIPLLIQLLFWIILLIASCYYFVGFVVHPFKHRRCILKQAENTTATVIDNNVHTDADGDKFYSPVLEFRDKEGNRFVVNAEVFNKYKYEPDQQIEIY